MADQASPQPSHDAESQRVPTRLDRYGFGSVDEDSWIDVDPEAAKHWDIRAWRDRFGL